MTQKSKRAIVAAVQLSSVSDLEFDASLAELRQVAKTLGFEVVATFTQKRAGFDKAAYFGTGKREELRLLREEHAADAILIDHEISPSQSFNLEKEVGGEVMDRTMVILEIFHRHARSRTARAQVEIARLGSRNRATRARQRHGGLHQEPAAWACRIVQVDARRGARGFFAGSYRGCQRSRVRAPARGDRRSARRDRRQGGAAPARLQQD